MASSNLAMTSSPTANPDLPSHPSICSLSSLLADLQHSDPSKNLTSMSMDDLLKTIYSDSQDQTLSQLQQDGSISRQLSFSLPKDMGEKTVDEVWKEIVAGSEQRRGAAGDEITLEDFLTKAGAVREEDVRVPVVAAPAGYAVDAAITDQFHIPSQGLEGPVGVYGNGIEGRGVGAGRGKRRAVEEPVDKATQQKQKRMIKNRESAARSRERKQAYTVELEALVTQLEEENSRLLREEAQQIKERCKQLKETLIPVAERRKPPRVLRRVQSMQW